MFIQHIQVRTDDIRDKYIEDTTIRSSIILSQSEIISMAMLKLEICDR